MNVSKRDAISTTITAVIIIVVIVVAGVAYYAIAYMGKSPTSSTTTSASMKAVVDLAGVTGDLGFNDLGVLGAQQATTQLGVNTTYVQLPDPSQATNILMSQAASHQYAIIVTIGFEWLDALNATSAQYPNQKFAIIDSLPEVARSNIVAVYYGANESSALGGVIAASYTHSDKIGIVLGQDTPVLYGFAIGFTYGVDWYVNATHHAPINVSAYFTGTFTDPSKGQAAAQNFINAGADVIWAAAGGTGLGALDAVNTYNAANPTHPIWAMGVDTDQAFVNPGYTITSVLKHVDATVVSLIKSVKDGTYHAGVQLGDLSDGLVGIADLTSLNQTLSFGVAGGKFTTAQENSIYSAESSFYATSTYTAALGYANQLKASITGHQVSIAYPQTLSDYQHWATVLGLKTNT